VIKAMLLAAKYFFLAAAFKNWVQSAPGGIAFNTHYKGGVWDKGLFDKH
jgi:hypothetical protein